MPVQEFLPHPRAIRRALADALHKADRLDLAVAFVGSDWADILGGFDLQQARLICWLLSTNTNPFAVRQMIARGVRVRHAKAMHAKVYLARGSKALAIVGSANLSSAALADDEAGGQFEAAIEVRSAPAVSRIAAWFDALWRSDAVSEVSDADLDGAELAWKAARKSRRASQQRPRRLRDRAPGPASALPPDWAPSPALRRLASDVRDKAIDDWDVVRGRHEAIARIAPERMDKATLRAAVALVVGWTGHPGAFQPVFAEAMARVRTAFATVFDEGLSIEKRLAAVALGGPRKLDGIGLTAWTLLLSWRRPFDYAPFNRRTRRFLTDFGLSGLLRTSLSPSQYAEWLAFAQDLSGRLRLPSVGHVDRLVWNHTEPLDLDG